jgi:type III pantothenate kinase
LILAIDIGNTNIEIGVLSEKKDDFNIFLQARYYTRLDITSDQIAVFIIHLLQLNQIQREKIKRMIFSSVVPPLNNLIKEMFCKYFTNTILEVNDQTTLNIRNLYKKPQEVGGDRLVNAAAAYYLYQKNCIIIDMGTATTLCALTDQGEYLGGSIVPGIQISVNALTEKAAKLPLIKMQKKEKLLSDNTVSSIESGIYFLNYYGLKGMTEQLAQEVGFKDFIRVGTGGYIHYFNKKGLIDEVESYLTLKGLKVIADLNF